MVNLEGYELIMGASPDPQFGPVILFGLGGQLVEVFKDSSLALPPLNSTLAQRMMERTKIYTALKGVRGRKSVDLDALERLVVRFSTLISEQPWIKELDINPLVASPERLIALDARVVLYGKDVTEDQLPRLAIRPYPLQYLHNWTAKDGSEMTIRPIRAEDEPMMVKFHESLSDRSVYMRFLHPALLSERSAHERLSRIAHSDYDREITLVADRHTLPPGDLRIVAASRMTKLHGTHTARFSVLISDCCQGLGIGAELVRSIIAIARSERLERLEAIMTPDNTAMHRLCENNGFEFTQIENNLIRATLVL
jgi:acetyltransferase